MKNTREYRRTGGEYAGKTLDDMLVSAPYIDQPPPEGTHADGEPLTVVGQMLDSKLNQWAILANALDHNDLNNLKAVYESLENENGDLKQINIKLMPSDVAIKQENTALKEKADSLAQTNPKIVFASLQNNKDISEIKE